MHPPKGYMNAITITTIYINTNMDTSTIEKHTLGWEMGGKIVKQIILLWTCCSAIGQSL
jgi:hypothetical protein